MMDRQVWSQRQMFGCYIIYNVTTPWCYIITSQHWEPDIATQVPFRKQATADQLCKQEKPSKCCMFCHIFLHFWMFTHYFKNLDFLYSSLRYRLVRLYYNVEKGILQLFAKNIKQQGQNLDATIMHTLCGNQKRLPNHKRIDQWANLIPLSPSCLSGWKPCHLCLFFCFLLFWTRLCNYCCLHPQSWSTIKESHFIYLSSLKQVHHRYQAS